MTDHDITWSEPYIYNGAMTAQPVDQVLPKMGRAVDAWGDKTDVPVVYQANFSSMNKSGYEGTGVALKLSPNGLWSRCCRPHLHSLGCRQCVVDG